jgi:Rho family protein
LPLKCVIIIFPNRWKRASIYLAVVQDGIEKADIDVIGLLHYAQERNAMQLAAFCLHFISNNYQPMKKRPEWKTLDGDNLKYVEEHQWPPTKYLDELAKYEQAIGKDKEKCIVM